MTKTCTAFAPGRTELAGNHVDHQNGIVLTSTLSLGITGEAATNDSSVICLESVGYGVSELDLSKPGWDAPQEQEFNTTAGLLRGAAAECAHDGIPVAGFDVKVSSTLPAGGGLSSSAAFELLLITIMQRLFSDTERPPIELARMAQRVECDYFGKKSGFMDQAAIAVGGIVTIDFGVPAVEVLPVEADFASLGYDVCLVDVGVDHSVNHADFASIPSDMWAVAQLLGVSVLEDSSEAELLAQASRIRAELGDVPFMRALHYFREVARVRGRATALMAGDMVEYCRLTALSGASSAQFLQNVAAPGPEQPAMVALSLVDSVLDQVAAETGGPRGVARIHGGGFGGTLQVYLPHEQTAAFAEAVDGLIGPGATIVLKLTQEGAWAR